MFPLSMSWNLVPSLNIIQHSQEVYAESVASTSSECDPEVGYSDTLGINHSEVALEGPLESTKAYQTSVPTHTFPSEVGYQINT